MKLLSRRYVIGVLASSGVSLQFGRRNCFALHPPEGWIKYKGNPVLGGQYGTCFDICVLHEAGAYRMWLSWRSKQSIAITESDDGIHWKPPEIVLAPHHDTGWEDDVNRPIVFHRDDGYHMWYTGQSKGSSRIGYALSLDGSNWIRKSADPVLIPSEPWEGVAVMCPHVMWDDKSQVWKMWYSGGEQYEPNAIGYATSKDGLIWKKYDSNPILRADPRNDWEKERVTAAQILYRGGWYYALYIGFRDTDHAQICLARSRDGVTGWIRHGKNPIVRPTPGSWDADACYKPFAVYAKGLWRLWYNGRHEDLEQIGLALHTGDELGFVEQV